MTSLHTDRVAPEKTDHSARPAAVHLLADLQEMGMTTYSEKLRHPNWQRKRLEILNRDGFKCRLCSSTETTLHVHHLRYITGRDPWNYQSASLITLCENCHSFEHAEMRDLDNTIAASFRDLGATNMDIASMAVAIDTSGSEDRQLSEREWSDLAGIVSKALKARMNGTSLAESARRMSCAPLDSGGQ